MKAGLGSLNIEVVKFEGELIYDELKAKKWFQKLVGLQDAI